MFDASKVPGLDSMQAIAGSQKANLELLQDIARSIPQLPPTDPGISAALEHDGSLGRAMAQKAEREAEVAAATIGNYRATAQLVEVVIKQGTDIATMATEFGKQSRLNPWNLAISGLAAAGAIAAVIVTLIVH